MAGMTPFSFGLIVTTGDEDTLDAALEAAEEFAKGPLRDILSDHDPLVSIVINVEDGTVIHC